MDLNKLAQEIYKASYDDEMAKLAQESSMKEYIPAAAALAAFLPLANTGSQVGRSAAESLVPIADWLSMKSRPDMGVGSYLNRVIGNRYGAAHLGTLGGIGAGALGSYLLYDYLKDKIK